MSTLQQTTSVAGAFGPAAISRYPSRCFRVVLLAVLIFSTGACGLFGGEEEEDQPAELVKFKSQIKIKKAWSKSLGGDTENLRLALRPVSDGKRIYAATHEGKVIALDALKGKKLWQIKTKVPFTGGPALGEGVLVIGSNNGDVVAVRADDGQELWRKKVSSEVLARPAVAGQQVFVRTVDGKLSAHNLSNGDVKWSVQQSVPRLQVRGTAAPVIRGNLVLCAFDNGKLVAYDISDGAVVWDVLLNPPQGRTEIERLADLNSTVQAIGQDVFAVGYQGQVGAVAIESGQLIWSRELSSYSGLSADLSNLYVSGQQSEVYALTRQAGREVWRNELLLFRDLTGPELFGQSVVVGDFEGYLHFLNVRTGEFQARTRAGSDRIASKPLVVNELLYVQTDGGKLYAFRDATRKKKGS
ncbi:MAG: outer membrane protein assembly factor BamB [Gammaproteobacteria bacterium]